jgi:hypothetical protein
LVRASVGVQSAKAVDVVESAARREEFVDDADGGGGGSDSAPPVPAACDEAATVPTARSGTPTVLVGSV